MPAIKKKWIKANLDGTDVPEDDNDDMPGDEDRELADAGDDTSKKISPKKRPAQSSPQTGLLRGLDGEVLLEKRKRFVPASELKLSEWLDNNLEKRTEETLHLPHLYNYYTELCQSDGSDIVDIPEFNRMVKEKFGKSFGLQETSVYKSLIKERKLNQQKKVGGGIKLKEIVHEAINHYGNPWNGVRFFSLKQYIGTKYPALQIDHRPKLLKRALEMGIQYGQIDLVKGIGMAGFYKLPGGEPPPPKVKPKSKKEESGEKQEEGAEEKGTEGEEGAEKVEGSAENGEKKEPEEEKKKKKQKSKKTEKVSLSTLHHGNPTKIEDTFPLAITYQSAPKAVSVPRIRRYLQEKYGEVLPDNRWRKVIESGAEKDYWEYVSGSGIAGKLHLLMDDFNPGSAEVEDMVCAAIIACHEPKAASAALIKKYVSQYHPEFKVEERPDKFKKALTRAISKNMIVQLSGLGASGTFQLNSGFIPSPSVLAGGDASSDEEVDSDGEAVAYVPRGTKSRGMPKLKTMEVVKSPPSKPRKKKGQKKSEVKESRKRGGKPKYADSSSEEEEEESEDEAPRRKNKNKPDKKKAAKGKSSSRKRARSSSPSDDEAGLDDEPEYTPRKSKSRGGSPQKTVKPAKQLEKKAAKVSKKKKAKAVESVKTSMMTSEGKRVSMLGIQETKSEKEGGKKSKSKSKSHSKSPEKKSKGKSPSKKQRVADSDDADADEESEAELEYTPRKSKSRGGGGDESGKKEKSSKSRK